MIRRCSDCGQKNRIPSARLADSSKCGACKVALPPVSKPVNVGGDEFRDIVANAEVPVLVDFWAAWCGPCRAAAPEVAKVAEEMAGKALVLKVDTEKHPEIAGTFGVRGIPNFVVLKDGKTVHQQAGLVDHRQMRTWLENA